MGTLLNRRRYMGGGGGIPPASSYIQDGLIFQLDGYEKGSTVNAWTDLIADIVFPIVQGMNTKGDCVEFASDRTEIFGVDGTVDCPRNSATIEVVHRRTGSVTNIFSFTGGVSASLGFSCESNSNNNISRVVQATTWYPNNTRAPSQSISGVSISTISITDTTSLFNGVAGGNGNGWSQTGIVSGKIIIGSAANGSRLFIGELYALRVYNRNLSAEEMLFNQQIDNQRFNLGLNI